jgi:excisionase family DNA binding protein
MQEQLAVNIPEAARRLGLSIRTVATLVSRRELASRKVGRRRIIPVAALEAFLRELPRAVPGDAGEQR